MVPFTKWTFVFMENLIELDHKIQRQDVGSLCVLYSFQHSLLEHTCVFANLKKI